MSEAWWHRADWLVLALWGVTLLMILMQLPGWEVPLLLCAAVFTACRVAAVCRIVREARAKA